MTRLRADLVHQAIDMAELERAVSHPSCGAVLLFSGNVRDHHGGRRVVRLCYSAYEPMARQRLLSIVEELEAGGRDARLRLAIVHRLGDVPIGEPSVVIAVASAHREAAYEANRTALERLKREVPIWKRETYEDGEEVWREEEAL
ncbi:MAG: molybdenum cofactor biosynthesis protein MoaE [Thermoanaerobaculia bacterium]|nr:molybdenum cofactor biosynthesis protein MoaE [Thermoanaerobaculia bacterium]